MRWLLLFLLSAIWGASYFFIAIALRSFPPVTVVAIRMGIAAVTLAAILAATRVGAAPRVRLPRAGRVYAHLALLGLVNVAVPFSLMAWAQLHVSSALTAILSSTTPLFVFAFASLLGGAQERFTWPRLLGATAAFAGIVVLFAGGRGAVHAATPAGALAIAAASAVFAAGNIYVRRTLGAVPALVAALMQSSFAFIYLVALAVLLERPPAGGPDPASVGAVVWLGVGASALAYVIYFHLLRHLGSTRTAMNTYLQPVMGIVLGLTVLDERLEPHTWPAVALTLTGVLVFAWASASGGGGGRDG